MPLKSLRHNGVLVPPPYQPKGLSVKIKGKWHKLTPQQEEKARRLLQAHRKTPYTPPTAPVAAGDYGVDAELLRVLIDRGDLVEVGDGVLFLRPVYEEMVARIVGWVEREGSITPSQARDLCHTTRRYIMPLLAHLDELKITRRVGDGRVLR